MHDKDSLVRQNVAVAGNRKHHDHLMHDEDPKVRIQVAKWGQKKHQDGLLYDSDRGVHATAFRRFSSD